MIYTALVNNVTWVLANRNFFQSSSVYQTSSILLVLLQHIVRINVLVGFYARYEKDLIKLLKNLVPCLSTIKRSTYRICHCPCLPCASYHVCALLTNGYVVSKSNAICATFLIIMSVAVANSDQRGIRRF